ncbi:MAG: response regulator transcription factor [Acidobacteriota bacterium]|nr:response regulator transcription factor [Acidobacteriota bacterium]
MIRVLLVEDDPRVASLIVRGCEALDIACDTAVRPTEALDRLRAEPLDLVLLDLGLPGLDGLDLLRRLRSAPATATLPVIILSGRGGESDRVVGLELGADDYVVKPASVRELVARMKTVLRRCRGERIESCLRVGSLVVDPPRRTALVGDRPLALRPKEFDLLTALVAAGGRVLSRSRLLEAVWNRPAGREETRTLDVHVRALRKKLGAEAARLVTHKGIGYAFRTDRLSPEASGEPRATP